MRVWREAGQGQGPAAAGVGAGVRFHGARLALGLALAIATYLLFPSAPAVDFALLETGSIAPNNVIAPFGFAVRKTPDELAKERDALARTVQPAFAYDT